MASRTHSDYELGLTHTHSEYGLEQDGGVCIDVIQNSPGCPQSPPPCPKVKTRNAQKLLPGYGAETRYVKYSLYGKRQLKRAGGALDESVPTDEVVFLTGTLPGSTVGAMDAIARYSSWVVHRLKAWVNKRCPSKLDMYVWERQRRGALHIHYLCHIPDAESRQFVLDEFHAQWRRLMLRLSVLSGVDVFERSDGTTWKDDPRFPRTDAQICESSAAGYLAKYASKESGKRAGRFCPNRWYGISRPLLSKLRDLTMTIKLSAIARYKSEALHERIFETLHETCAIVREWKELAFGRYGFYAATETFNEAKLLCQKLSYTLMTFSGFRKRSSLERYGQMSSEIDLLRNLRQVFTDGNGRFSEPLVEHIKLAVRERKPLRECLDVTDWQELRSIFAMCRWGMRYDQRNQLELLIQSNVHLPGVRESNAESNAISNDRTNASTNGGTHSSDYIQTNITGM